MLIALSSIAHAQQGSPVELGLDALYSYSTDSPHLSTLVVPFSRVRAGFAISPNLTLEPSAALSHFSAGGADATNFTIGAGLLYHFNADRSAVQPYVRPFVEYAHSTATGAPNLSNSSVGAGLGVKIPVTERFKWRLEAGYAASNHSSSGIRVLAGFSIFTH